MSEQGGNALEGQLHNHGGDIHVEYGSQHHYVIAQVSRHEVIDKRQATLLAEQIVFSWNEHNALLRQRDALLDLIEKACDWVTSEYWQRAARDKIAECKKDPG